jgi:CheY-like chemotaxis protein
MRILIVDDEKIKRVTLADDLTSQGHEVVAAADGQEALGELEQARFDVVVTDLKMPNIDGLELLKRIKQGRWSDMEVIMMTAYGSIPVAVEAVKSGAYDFITKPFRNEDIFPLLARIERQKNPPDNRGAGEPLDIDRVVIGQSPTMTRVKRMIEICARTDANVLVFGETGVGKDLIAGVIHRSSYRAAFPLVKVGCTLFPPQLIESELYGHVKGSFTGADQERQGRFDLAEGGTLYLDDVDDIPLAQQSKLLRAIEEKVFERVGGTALINANVRIVASTKQNLLEKISHHGAPASRTPRRHSPPGRASSVAHRHGGPLPPGARRPGPVGTPRLAGQRARAVAHAGTRLPGRRGAHHRRTALGRDPQQRAQCLAVGPRFPGRHGPGRASTAGKRPARRQRKQDRRRRRPGHEDFHLPRQARQARPGLNGGRFPAHGFTANAGFRLGAGPGIMEAT